MKKITYLILLITSISFAQNPEAAEKMVIEGVHLHDEGKYNQALAKYDEALKTDKDNFCTSRKSDDFGYYQKLQRGH